MNINLYINKQSVRAEAPEIFSGSVGVLTVTLFGELDTSMIPVLRFMHESGEAYYTAKIENGTAIVPHEVIQSPGFTIAVAGYENDGEVIKRFLPTEAAYIAVLDNGYGSPDDAVSEEAEAESLIGQILGEVEGVRGEITAAKEELSKEVGDAKAALADDVADAKQTLQSDYNSLKATMDDYYDAFLGEEHRSMQEDERINNSISDVNKRIDNAEASIRTEGTVREGADDALRARIADEEEGRITVCSKLSADIESEASKRMSADVAIQESISSESKARKAADDTLLAAVADAEAIAKGRATGYVFDTYDDMTAWLADTANTDKLVLGDNLYIRATDVPDYWWDGSAPQQLETQKVDLSEYVQKEEGYGLSDARRVSMLGMSGAFGGIGGGTTGPVIRNYMSLEIKDQHGNSSKTNFYSKGQIDEYYYTSDEVDEKLYKKKDEISFSPVWHNDEETEATLYLVPDGFCYVGNALTRLHVDFEQISNFEPGKDCCFMVAIGETINFTSTEVIKWVGDDCEANGIFTPQPNSAYEVSVAVTPLGYLARVGAC